MNRRQAKKKFKKQYGVTPEKLATEIVKALSPEQMKRFTDAVSRIVEAATEAIRKMTEILKNQGYI